MHGMRKRINSLVYSLACLQGGATTQEARSEFVFTLLIETVNCRLDPISLSKTGQKKQEVIFLESKKWKSTIPTINSSKKHFQ